MGICDTHGELRNMHKVLVGEPKRRPRRRWEDNAETYLEETGCEGAEWS